jgi:serine/threonine protein kinase
MRDLRANDRVYGQSEDEEYLITRPIGNGAFGIVYEVRDRENSTYALKTILTAFLNEHAVDVLMNEGSLATKIQHENVLRVLFFHDGKKYKHLPPYMIMEFADGGTLERIINEKRLRGEFFPQEELRPIFIQLAEGMKAINAHLVHRDIKPDNILVKENSLKIADFGLSKIVSEATRTQSFKGINHIRYCAPEAWRLENNSPAMDMYSMGVVFFEVATLQHPYQVKNEGNIIEAWKNAHFFQTPSDPRDYNPSLDMRFVQLIKKMMLKRPQDRYETWEEVIQRLKAFDSSNDDVRQDVSTLLERALKTHNKQEQARLKYEEQKKRIEERNNLVKYRFEEIMAAANQIIVSFNSASEFVELSLTHRERPSNVFASNEQYSSFSIHRVGSNSPSVTVEVSALYDSQYVFDDNPIMAWGNAKSPSGKGFNLFLVPSDSDDLYGQWQTSEAAHNPLIRLGPSGPEPFPFDLNNLMDAARSLLVSHDSYISKRTGVFKPTMLNPLVEELL